MRAALGYERMPMGEANITRAFRRGIAGKRKLKIHPDVHNNKGRTCNLRGIEGDIFLNSWIVETPLYDQDGNRYYLVRSLINGQTRIVCDCDMHNLY